VRFCKKEFQDRKSSGMQTDSEQLGLPQVYAIIWAYFMIIFFIVGPTDIDKHWKNLN